MVARECSRTSNRCLPAGYTQRVVAREGDGGTTDNWDMNTLNETGPSAGRFLFRSHETLENGQVSVTDLVTGETRVLVERADWNRMDGIVWTPWQTLLTAEEMRPERQPSTPDPMVPQAQAGLLDQVDAVTGDAVPRPALGAKAHEGIRFDPQGNVYGISETAPNTVVTPPPVPGQPPPTPRPAPGGYIFKFVPDRPADLSSGQLYALKIVNPDPDPDRRRYLDSTRSRRGPGGCGRGSDAGRGDRIQSSRGRRDRDQHW